MKRHHNILLILITSAYLISACNTTSKKNSDMITKDPHSYAQYDGAVVKHLNLDAEILFDEKIIRAKATWSIDNISGADKIWFDTRDLDIKRIFLDEGMDTPFEINAKDPLLGQALSVDIRPGTKKITILYATRPGAAALQWLDPQQTAGKKHPFLFTQSQAILARTWLPCQDSPGVRFTYDAKVRSSNKDLLVVMSAQNPLSVDSSGVYSFRMDQPIPSYLMAMAAGNIVFKEVGMRTGVYAEPEVIGKAVYEFADMEKMLLAAEKLYGPYRWERYDVIVLPPSFPFGGMENPRLTFATPTILAGDRSLTSLVAHELAHSWSGNLVTNATWDDFWLNEGFTVYFESRIMESVYGKSYAEMLNLLNYQDLVGTIAEMGKDNPDTKLKLNLKGRNPDDGLTDIAYNKGYMFLRLIEETIGRDQFDSFLRTYFDEHAFKVMTTEGFLDYLNRVMIASNPDVADKIKIKEWVYGPGLPLNCPVIVSDRFEKVDLALNSLQNGIEPNNLETGEWSTHEWLHFIRKLSPGTQGIEMASLDNAFGFTRSGNAEIKAAWFEHVIAQHYTPAYPALEEFLIGVGRRKFLKPLYKSLAATTEGMEMAKRIYLKARPNYHSVSTGTIDEILRWGR